MRTRGGSFVRVLGIGLGIAAITLALLEIGARAVLALRAEHGSSAAQIRATLDRPEPTADGGDANERAGPHWMQEHVLHPYLGFVRNPALERHRLNQSPVDVPVNRFGFFGPDPMERRAAPEPLRIGLFGGSVAAELFLGWRDVLEREIGAAQGRQVEVVSLALDGLKQPQQLLALAWFLARGARLDVVVNLDGFNEVALPFAENLALGVAPDFPRSWRAYAARTQSVETTRLLGRQALERERLERLRNFFGAWPWRESHAALMLWHTLHRRHARAAFLLEERLRRVITREDEPIPELTGPFTPPSSDTELVADAARLWRDASLQMHHLADGGGLLYLHFLQPNQYAAGAKVLTAREKRLALAPPANRYRRGAELGYPKLIAAGRELAEAGVRFHDLTRLFADERGPIYRDTCCHYTPRGYQLVATEIARAVSAALLERTR